MVCPSTLSIHRVLYVEEILREIFSYLLLQLFLPFSLWEPGSSPRDVLAVARTCRAFKEPALDILWEVLPDLTPLVRCLPEASSVDSIGMYSLNRPLQQADWDIILGYTHRVRELPQLYYECGLTAGCFKQLSKPPSSTVSIFPKFISPGLTHLSLFLAKSLGSVHVFGEGCPNVKWFYVAGVDPRADPGMISDLICHWPNLHRINCREVGLNVAAVTHLSCLHSLDYLRFQLHGEVVEWIQSCQSGTAILTFATLRTLSVDLESLASGWRFLYHLRLPVIEDLTVQLYAMPTVLDIMSFLAGLQATCTHDTLHHFALLLREHNSFDSDYEFNEDPPQYHIASDHLRPLTVFTNIQSIIIDLECGVDLDERGLLCLAASWPHIEQFAVYDTQLRTEATGITPGGFVQLLERCRSLRSLYVNFDVRGYTEPPQGHPWHGLRMPERACLYLQNSPIEEESVYALGVFFHVAPYPDFQLDTRWKDLDFLDDEIVPEELCDVYHDRGRGFTRLLVNFGRRGGH